MLTLLLAITLTWPTHACTPEKFTVEFIPPDTYAYTSTLKCGGIQCEETWIVSDGKRIGAKSTCPLPDSSSPSSSPRP